MLHLGDIAKINGFGIPVVDCITGGSPCQDLSIAGKRAGLAGERSGLFMEQIRVIKEMRHGNGTSNMARPRFMVWENVPGAFSSNRGEDFRVVLEETARIAEPGAVIPRPEKWTHAGCVLGDGWSIAWRLHDAQFWGVPQRRKRIALVADFGGMSAPEVLFERKGLRRDTETGGTQGEETSGGAGDGASCTGWRIKGNAIDRDTNMNGRWANEDVSFTLDAADRHGVAYGFKAGQSMAGSIGYQLECAATLSSKCSGTEPTVFDARGNGDGIIPPALTGGHQNLVTDYTALCVGNGQLNQISMAEQANTLDAMHDQQMVLCYGLDSNKNGYKEQAGAPQSHEIGGMTEMCCDRAMAIRRLTPLECERLQGYPDGWTDIGEWVDGKGKIRRTSDTARYKALGNSIALPFWFWLLRRISAQYERPATLGSLFDGIGGFPLCWEKCNGKGTALWASEIDEFCMAVTKRRFGEG